MTKRTLAAAALAALPFAAGPLRADCIRATDAAAARSVAEHDGGPRWVYVLGDAAPFTPQLIACPNTGWRCLLSML